MKNRNLLLPSATALLFIIMAVFGCERCGPPTVPCEAAKPLKDSTGIEVGKACFVPGEVITNTTEYTQEDEDALFKYLDSLGFTPTDTCKCLQKLIRWGKGDATVLEVIGAVSGSPEKGGGVGSVGLNNYVSVPEPEQLFNRVNLKRNKGQKNFDQEQPSTPALKPGAPTAYITIIDTGIDPRGGNLDIPRDDAGRRNVPQSGGGPVCDGKMTDTPTGLDITDANSPAPRDWNGHGTHVNGIAARVLDSDVETHIELRNVKVSSGKTGEITLFNFLCALYYALEATPTPHVINVSLGWEDNAVSEIMRPLLRKMDTLGVLMVAGAGNRPVADCMDSTLLFWPAAFSRMAPDAAERGVVLSVGAWDATACALWENSNRCFDVAAPGVNILSSHPRKFLSPSRFATGSGTSMAAPYVSYIAAELRALDPALSPADVKRNIIADAKTIPQGTSSGTDNMVKVVIREYTTTSCN